MSLNPGGHLQEWLPGAKVKMPQWWKGLPDPEIELSQSEPQGHRSEVWWVCYVGSRTQPKVWVLGWASLVCDRLKDLILCIPLALDLLTD